MKKRVPIFIFLILAILPLISSQYIYGDIYVKENGNVVFYVESDVDPEIEGISFYQNTLRGSTYSLTNMDKGIWTFSFDLGKYDNILVDVHLPTNLKSIKTMKGVDNAIDFDEKVISLIDENTDLIFRIDYELEERGNYGWVYFLIILILVAAVVYFSFRFTKKKRALKAVFPYLNDHEERILKLLIDRPLRQKTVREKLGVPKASFTRYILNLEKKKLIVREGEGKNKILRLR